MPKIFIDPGHGGKDPGAVGSAKEKDVNLSVGLKLKALLISKGFEVLCSREDDTFIDLTPRCDMANKFKADLFVSVHHNAGGGGGYEVINSINGGKGKTFANILAEEFKAIGQVPHGPGTYSKPSTVNPGKDYYAVIRQTNMPAVISEFAYMDSADFNKVATDVQQMQEAITLAKAVCEYFGIAYVEVMQPVVEQPQPHWAQPLLDKAKAKGLISGDHDLDKPLTLGELLAVMDKAGLLD